MGNVLVSSNGTAWDLHATGSTNALRGLTFGKDVFVAVGNLGTVLVSANGSIWTTGTTGVTENLGVVLFGAGLFVAGGDSGLVLTSSDGLSWTNQGKLSPNALTCMAYGAGRFVIGDSGGTVRVSRDGTAWSTSFSGPSTLTAMAYGEGEFTSADFQGLVRISPDGTNWVLKNVNTLIRPRGMVFAKGSFTLVGELGMVLQSDPVLKLLPGNHSQAGFSVFSVGETGAFHNLEMSADLMSWGTLTNFLQDSSSVTITDPVVDVTRRFYRVRTD
jgi:hypothetical protein